LKKFLSIAAFLALCTSDCWGQTDIYDSGGPLTPGHAAYDVTFYDLDLRVDPDNRSIEGRLTLKARIVNATDILELDLDTLLNVSGVEELNKSEGQEREFHRQGGKLLIHLAAIRRPGEWLTIAVDYGGKPREAPWAPWNGGFSWARTPSGAHWIATSCQGEGADIWWPVKDHVSDKPDSMALHIRVPDPLVVATNGKFIRKEPHSDETSTYHWFVSTPISAYNIALNIAPYRTIETEMTSVDGSKFPVIFYVLPEDFEKGQKLFPQFLEHLRFFEELLGPYPFRADKYGVAQTPHLGMEHQTIIAYGANFSNASMTGFDWGFDALHQHELAHEWWGNLVTNSDWRDMWLHEGFGSYMQPLYVEKLKGKEAYQRYMSSSRRFANTLAVAPRESKTADEIYRAPIYAKGAWVLHTLRYLIGDDAFFRSLRRMAYPDPALEKITDGSQVRFATTDDFLHICEQESGMKLDWFFEVYLRQPKLPRLISRVQDNQISLRWESPVDLPFPMPVEVRIGDKTERVEIPKEGTVLTFPKGEKPEVDPDKWVLMEVGRQ
jgi:aminopeptidase N